MRDTIRKRQRDVLSSRRDLYYERRICTKEADISYATLSNTFNRNKVPSVPIILRICEGFHITVAEFFNEGGTLLQQLTASDQRLIADFHRLSGNDKKLVTAFLQGLLQKSNTVHRECQ